MTRSHALPGWPWSAADGDPVDLRLGLDTLFEAQTRLWNHLLDANRSLWDSVAPWVQVFPWLAGALAAAELRPDPGTEPFPRFIRIIAPPRRL